MVDHAFADREFAALYDPLNGTVDREDFRFYLPWIMSARSVLDVGCGTGALLHQARRAGHAGRLCGLDPALGMLERARARSDIEWILGDLGTTAWNREFELVVMTGHAFQVFVEDEELRTALAAIRSALTDTGQFAFETRNPLVRAWERWTPDAPIDAVGPTGAPIRLTHQLHTPVRGDRVAFTSTVTSSAWDGPWTSHSTLRFLDAGTLSGFLSEAGLEIAEQFGDWDRGPLTGTSPEIITFARRASSATG